MRGLFGAIAAPSLKDVRTLDSLPSFLIGPESKTGITVTWSAALEVTAMLACAKVVSEGIAQSRCKVVLQAEDGSYTPQLEHPLYRLLYRKPNKWQSAFEFWETLVFHVMLVGNAYVFLNKVAGDRIYELLIIEPSHVAVTRMDDLSLVYDVTMPDNRYVRLDASKIWHVRGPSWNGWMGMETVRLAREALGLSIALEAGHAAIHKNGAQASGVYSIENELTDPQHTKLTNWLEKYAQQGRSRPLILDRGAKWLQQQMTGVDAQHVETRRLQIEEVCRAVRVIPLMVGQSDKTATYASVEQLLVAHVVHTLAPWAGRLESSADVGLFTDDELDQGLQLLFDLTALMRGDYKARQEGLQIQRNAGVINANDWRRLEGMNPRKDKGGDQYLVMSNMTIQDGRDLQPVKTPAPKLPADPADPNDKED